MPVPKAARLAPEEQILRDSKISSDLINKYYLKKQFYERPTQMSQHQRKMQK
jgi:hypothetical protein